MAKKTLDYHKALCDIATEINSPLAVEEVLNAIVKSIAKAINAKGCSLMLLTPDREQLIHTTAYGLSDWYLRKGPVKADATISEALRGKPVVILDACTDHRVQYKEQAKKEGIASMLSIPLTLRGEVIGISRIYTAEPHEFCLDEIEFLTAAANLGAIALGKARLYESAERDYERRLTEKADQLKQTIRELAKLEKGKEQLMRFLSIVAHDLKAPLAAIQSYFGVLLGGFAGELNDKQKQMIERSSQRINGLLNLVSDLLDISRIEMGQVIQEMKEVSLAQVIKEPVEDAQSAAEQKGLKFIVDSPAEAAQIYASPDRLHQALRNLLNNAIKFTPEGGVVTLRLRTEHSELRGEVIDTGIGIPDQDLPHVFEDFYRASNVEAPGTGLGLSIVKRIIEAHGGKVWVESPSSETGIGCKFGFTLPLERGITSEGGENS